MSLRTAIVNQPDQMSAYRTGTRISFEVVAERKKRRSALSWFFEDWQVAGFEILGTLCDLLG